jgi:hypothetical protein
MSTFPEFFSLPPQPEPQDVEVVTALCDAPVSTNPIDLMSEDETASRSHADSIGLSSTTSWQPEEQTHGKEMDTFSHDTQPPKDSFSIDLKELSKWSEEKENVCYDPAAVALSRQTDLC